MTDKRTQLDARIEDLRSELHAAIAEREALDAPTVQCEAETEEGVRCKVRVKGVARCVHHRAAPREVSEKGSEKIER
jgi:hypothetical protein